MTAVLSVGGSVGAATGVFDRVLCGIDGSEAGQVAAAQAEALTAPGGSLELLAAVDPPPVWPNEFAAPAVLQGSQEQAERALAAAAGEHPRATATLELGSPAAVLCEHARASGGTLLAVGSHGGSRAAGLLLGSTATSLLHRAPCSVLLARPTTESAGFPRSILVGTDGSAHAQAAVAVATELAARLDAWLRFLVATGSGPIDIDRVGRGPRLEWSGLAPVEALVRASRDYDLLVLGSRGLRGLHALGSVGERVGHAAACSVLVVRAEGLVAQSHEVGSPQARGGASCSQA